MPRLPLLAAAALALCLGVPVCAADKAPATPDPSFCKEYPDRCEELKQRRQDYCRKHPDRCDELRKDHADKSMPKAKSRGKSCDRHPERCEPAQRAERRAGKADRRDRQHEDDDSEWADTHSRRP